MSVRSILAASASALALFSAVATQASACGLAPAIGAGVAAGMAVGQTVPQPALPTLSAPDLHSSFGDIHSAPAVQPVPAAPAAAAALAARAADPS